MTLYREAWGSTDTGINNTLNLSVRQSCLQEINSWDHFTVFCLFQRATERQSAKKQEEATKLLQQRDSQITALSDNLVLVRTDLERSGRRNDELEDLAKSLNQQIEGEINHLIIISIPCKYRSFVFAMGIQLC